MNVQALLSLAQADQGLSQQEKAHLLELCKDQKVVQLLSGAAGAAIGVSAAKYSNLGRTAQVLLGIAGFGIGRLLYDYLRKRESRQFAHWNDKMDAYEINSSRY